MESKEGGGKPSTSPGETDVNEENPPSSSNVSKSIKWKSKNKYLCSEFLLPGEEKSTPIQSKKKAINVPKYAKEEKSLACEICGKTCSKLSNLHKHLMIHSGLKSYECPHCDKKFPTKFALERHKFIHNPEEGKINCPICDKRFPTKDWMKTHLQRHADEKPFSCSQCEKAFSTQGDLNRHVKSHNDDKEFLCSDCGKLFHSNHTLQAHETTHTDEREFPCTLNQCRLKFKRPQALARHLLTHQVAGTIPCPLDDCDHNFRRKDNLLRHLRLTHNQTKDEAKNICKSIKFSIRSPATPSTPSIISNDDIPESPFLSIPKQSKPKKKPRRIRKTKATVGSSVNHPKADIQQDSSNLQTDSEVSNMQTSVATSVIRLAKSFKHDTNLPENPQGHAESDHLPYPARNPSPGQEYINYLNSINKPISIWARERSHSYGHYSWHSRDHYTRPASDQVSSKWNHNLSNPSYNNTVEDNVPVYTQMQPVMEHEVQEFYRQGDDAQQLNGDQCLRQISTTEIDDAFNFSKVDDAFSYQNHADFGEESTPINYEREQLGRPAVIKLCPPDQNIQEVSGTSFLRTSAVAKEAIINRDPRKNFLLRESVKNAGSEYSNNQKD